MAIDIGRPLSREVELFLTSWLGHAAVWSKRESEEGLVRHVHGSHADAGPPRVPVQARVALRASGIVPKASARCLPVGTGCHSRDCDANTGGLFCLLWRPGYLVPEDTHAVQQGTATLRRPQGAGAPSRKPKSIRRAPRSGGRVDAAASRAARHPPPSTHALGCWAAGTKEGGAVYLHVHCTRNQRATVGNPSVPAHCTCSSQPARKRGQDDSGPVQVLRPRAPIQNSC
eukprot:scaffold1626_cov372-Prasinococcus_capsulatus_cf.AAC.6